MHKIDEMDKAKAAGFNCDECGMAMTNGGLSCNNCYYHLCNSCAEAAYKPAEADAKPEEKQINLEGKTAKDNQDKIDANKGADDKKMFSSSPGMKPSGKKTNNFVDNEVDVESLW